MPGATKRRRARHQSIAFEFDVQTQGTDFLDQHVERLGHPGFDDVVALDDALVHLGAALRIVGLDGEHFLQHIRGAVGFERPDFHLAETLTAELRLAAQRLLRDQRVRAGGAGVHLVVNQVMQLEHVHDAHGHRALEDFASAAIGQHDLLFRRGELQLLGDVVGIGQVEHLADFGFAGAVEHRAGDGQTGLEVAGEFKHLGVAELIERFLLAAEVVKSAQEFAQLGRLGMRLQHVVDPFADADRGPAQVGFENLPDVHARRHAQRVEHDVHRGAIRHVRHVFDRNDLGHHTLVAVTAGHLVAWLQAALDGQVNLDHLEHAGGQLIALGELAALLFEHQIEGVAALLQRVLELFHLLRQRFIRRADVEPVIAVGLAQVVGGDGCALGQLVRAAVGGLASEQLAQTVEGIGLDDAHLVVEVEAIALELVVDDLLGALVTRDAFAGEHLHVNDGAVHARGHAQRGVLHVGRLFAEDGAQQLLFRGELGLALGGDLAHKHVARFHFRAHVNDARLVQTRQLVLGQIGNVAGDFFGAQLGVARRDVQLFDVDGGEAIFGHHALGQQDRVFVVVAVPRHEGHQHVLAQRQFAEVGRSAVGHDIALGEYVAALDQRALVDVGVLVGTLVFDEVVDVHADFARLGFVVIDAHHDAGAVHIVHHPAAQGGDHGARVDRGHALDPGADQGLFRTQHGHGLTLHVGAHQRAVGVVVLQEGHERGRGRHDLAGRHVHVLHPLWRDHDGLASFAGRHQLVVEHAVLVHAGIGLGDDVLAFFDGREVVDLVSHLTVDHAAIRCLDEAVFVQPGEQRQRVDQTDVRAFRRFDRADAAVVRGVHVAHFKTSALARQAARAQGRDAALVGDFRQRVGLIHELRELRGAEEFLDRRRNGLGVDEVVRHQVFGLGLAQTFLHRALDARQPGTELVLGQLAHAAHAAVAEVVDVIDFAAAVAQLDQQLDDRHDVFMRQHHLAFDLFATEAAVELHAAHARQVVGVSVEEQAVEQSLDGVFGRRLAGAHHAVDRHLGPELVGHFIDAQGLRNERALVEVVDVEGLDLLNAGFADFLQQRLGELLIGAGHDLAGVL